MAKAKSKKTSPLTLDARVVGVDTIHENDWNPNRQSDRAFEAEKESITAFGFIDPISVRKHPKIAGEWQVVDGAHRLRAVRELGYTEVSVNVLDVTEAEAKKLTIILNETKGTPDRIDLGHLLADLRQTMSEDDLLKGLPYSHDELQGLLDLPDFNFDQFDKKDPKPKSEDDEWDGIKMRVPLGVMAMFLDAKEKVVADGQMLHEDEEIANGQVLEILLAEFMAG